MTGTPTGADTLLDGDLVRRRRLSLGISERDLARRLGVTGVVINNLERGLNHDDLPAGLLADLARHLGLAIADLFTTPPTPTAEDSEAEDAADDAATVGTLLAVASRGVPAAVLADATGWPLDRVTSAVDELEARLASVGQTLLRFGDGEVKLVPRDRASDRNRVQAMLRRAYARTGMNVRQASMLYRVMRGQVTGAEQRNSDRVALAELVNAGLVEWPPERASRPRLSDDVRVSLAVVAEKPTYKISWLRRRGARVIVTAMSFGADLVAKLLGLPEIPSRRIRHVMVAVLAATAVAFPITFRHGIELYAQREAQQITQRVIDPLLQRLAPSSTAPAGTGPARH